MTDPTISKIIAILREDFQVNRVVTVDSLVCFDLGVCDGEFQDLMMCIEERFAMQLPEPCHVPFAEENASVGDLADWVRSFII